MTLDAALLAAHAKGDKHALVSLYRQAADAANDDTARAFFLTQAYVFALDSGSSKAREIHLELAKTGRV